VLRGIISGSIWGGIASALILAVASLVAEQPPGNAPPATPEVAPPPMAQGDTEGGEGAEVPSQAPDAPSVPELPEAPVPDAEASAPEAETSPAEAPVPLDATEAPVAPAAGDAPEAPASGAEPGIMTDPGAVLSAPEAETAIAEPEPTDGPVTTAPVEEPAAPVVSEGGPEAPAAEAAPEAMDGPVVVDAPEPARPPAIDTGTADVQEAAEPAVPEQPVVAAEPGALAPGTDAAPDETVVILETPETEPLPGVGQEADAEETPAPRIVLQSEAAPQLPSGDSRIVIRRPGDAAADEPETETVQIDPEAGAEGSALQRFAATFDNPEGKPLVGIVLMDEGRLPLDAAAAAVAEVPFPVTVAINPARSDAAEAMAAYRALGLEVAAMPVLPAGAQATDVELTLEASFAALPEAVALLDAGSGGWQGSAEVGTQTAARLASEGRGLVVVSQGLNQGVRGAEAEGVPVSVVFRDLDPDAQDARVIRRFLDQAAFRARQSQADGGVVLLGRVRPDTLTALIIWATANRAGQVALAPLSAVLNAP
jgi:polysaccharide deacetylase 2 family uncharacterized protein YibQ